MARRQLIVSASGGRTSMYMAVWLKKHMSDQYDLSYLFANTGQEMDETLDFVERVDRKWGLGVIWLEAVTHYNKRQGCTYRVVDHSTAARRGEPFEDMIKKYGIPNQAFPHCTRELKQNPMMAWRRDNAPEAEFAVGIRIDEIDRMSANAQNDRIIYPLVSINPKNKAQVIEWWRQYSDIDLRIPEHHGNCKWCWKKSDRKLMTIATDNPEFFDFPARMEQQYEHCGAGTGDRVFFRKNRSTQQLLAQAASTDFVKFTDSHVYNYELDLTNGCTDSCDVFADDAVDQHCQEVG